MASKWPSRKSSNHFNSLFPEGAEDGTRTRDLLITNQLLYQLSYFGVALQGGLGVGRAGAFSRLFLYGIARCCQEPRRTLHASAPAARLGQKARWKICDGACLISRAMKARVSEFSVTS